MPYVSKIELQRRQLLSKITLSKALKLYFWNEDIIFTHLVYKYADTSPMEFSCVKVFPIQN